MATKPNNGRSKRDLGSFIEKYVDALTRSKQAAMKSGLAINLNKDNVSIEEALKALRETLPKPRRSKRSLWDSIVAAMTHASNVSNNGAPRGHGRR